MGSAVWLALLGDQVPYLIAAMVVLMGVEKALAPANVTRKRWRGPLVLIGISFSSSATHVLLTQTAESKEARGRDDFDRRLAALTKVDLFVGLSDEERRTLAASLLAAPFARGELMTKQGAASNWLFENTAARAELSQEAEKSLVGPSSTDFLAKVRSFLGGAG